METQTFTSPLSFYTVETDYGYDALSVQPEERSADLGSHTHDASPYPYFEDSWATGSTPEMHHDMTFLF